MNGKRILSFILALAMVLGMVPFNALPTFAAEVADPADAKVGDTTTTKTDTAPTDVEYGVWKQTDSGTTCGNLIEHTHSDSCYYKSCDHNDGHLSSCYSESTSYALCTHSSDTEHTGSVNVTDVVTITGSGFNTRLEWNESHPACAVVKARYQELGGKWYNALQLLGEKFCYTTSASAEPDLCTHTCSELGGSCYTKTCVLNEHTHSTGETGCYEYTWTLMADENNNDIIDGEAGDPYYTVTYTDGVDGVELFADQMTNVVAKDGNLVKVPAFSGTPSREGYTFKGWSPEVPATLTAENHVFTAVWEINKYTVTWNAGAGTFTEGKTVNTTVNHGNAPVAPATPSIADDAQYNNEFAGWDATGDGVADDLTAVSVTGNMTIDAVYTTTTNSYTVTWVGAGENGADVTEVVEYGKAPTLNPAVPEKTATDEWTYSNGVWVVTDATAANWVDGKVQGNVTFKAQYTETKNEYTVTWIVNNVTVATETLAYGTVPTRENPAGYTDNGLTYTFVGWDSNGDSEADDLVAVTGNVTYTAVFSSAATIYNVVYKDGETVLTTQNVEHGKKASGYTVPADKIPAGYRFGGWLLDGQEFDFDTVLTGDITLTAKWVKVWTVSFEGVDKDPIIVDEGSKIADIVDEITIVDTDSDGKVFRGWLVDGQLVNSQEVYEDVTVKANWGPDTDNDDEWDGGSNDPYYEVKFWDELSGEGGDWVATFPEVLNADQMSAQNYNVTAPYHEDYVFVEWVEGATGNYYVNYVAVYAVDANNNGVADSEEMLRLNISGNGTVTINGVAYEHGDSILYDSTKDTVTVVATPADTTNGDGNIGFVSEMWSDYSWQNGQIVYTFTAAGAQTQAVLVGLANDVIYVEFGNHDMGIADEGTIAINGFSSETKVENLKKAILDAMLGEGQYDIDEYDVYMNTSFHLDIFGGVDVPGDYYNVEGDVYTVNLPFLGERSIDISAELIASTIEIGKNESVRIVKKTTPEVSKTITLKVEDSRKPAVIGDLTYTTKSYDTVEQLEADLVNYFTVEDVDGNDITSGISVEVNGTTATVTVTAGENWLAATRTFENVTWTVNQYEITWVDGNGNKLYSEMLDYGATPSYTGATPVKDQTVSTTYTFTGWGEIVAVTGNVTYTAQFSEAARIYVISWDTNGDGTVDTTTEVAYGATPGAPAYAEIANKSFAGWSPAIAAVSGEATYTATYSDDTIYHIEFMVDGVLYNEQYINVTKKPTAVIDNPGNPDKDHFIFDGWDVDVIGMTPTANVVVNAKWVAETNNNNVRDEEETVAVQVPNGGSISFNGTAPTDGAFIFDSTNNNYTIVITPPEAHYVASAEIEGVNLAARTVSVTYSNGVMTISGVALTNGDTIKVTFAKHQIPVAENPTIVVNGKDADSKLAIVTKRAVLETILGRAVSDEEFAQYEVKVMVNAAGYNGYYDIWALIDGVSGKDDVISQTALSALKSAFNTAIDVPGSENFEITWAAHDQYPEVKAVVSVALVESREPATAEHNGTVYTATELDDALLNTIKGHITSDTGINSIEWVDPEMTLIPGTTMDVLVRVTTKENTEFYSKTYELVVKIKVPTGNIDAKIDPTATIYFNTGMSDTDKVTLVLNEVPPVYYVTGSDIIATDVVVNEPIVVKYLASTARNVPYTLNIAQLDLGVAGNFLPDTIEVQIPVDELWLPMTAKGNDFPVYEAPSNELIRDILLNELIPEYAADYIAGNITTDQLKQIAADLLAEHEEIGNYYKYLGAHQFGEFAQETIRYEIDTNYGLKITNDCVLNMVDERDEVTIKLNTGVEVVYNNYTAEGLLAQILDGVYFGEDKIDGLTVELVTDVEGLPASDASEITVKFAGNEAYKPATATVAVKINKAPLTLSVDNRLFKYPESLNYTLGDVIITKSNGVLVDVDTINFIAGLNISDVNIDGGLKGFVAQVQLMLPEELQSLLTSADSILQSAGVDVSFANGASMKLSELIAAVDAMDEIFAGSEYEEYFRVLLNVLQSLPTEVADIEIIIGGGLPTDIGVYLVGSISADSNYETAYGAGAIVITPDGIKAELAWNEEDDNGIITNSLLVNNLFDTGAHAVSVGEGGTIEEANKQIVELFVGLNIDELDNELKGLVIELDQTKLGVGAYVEVALISEFGNVMYYAEPIFRPIVVVAETLNVDFGDASGAVNNERHFEFFNVPQNGMEENLLVTYKQNSKDGTYAAGDVVTDYTVKYFYAGIQTNGTPYASTTAPVYAGVYTITAVVIVREDGVITHAGQGIGALVIEPSKSTTDVENEAIKWDGNPHTFNQYVTVGSVNVPTITPDKTVITVGISADLDANIGLSAIKGTVNVDLPKWFDELMSKLGTLEAGYADGITVDVFKGYVQKIQEALVELGVETESFDKVVSVINQLNGNVTLTFHDDKGYTDVGAYLVIGVVTDSDHYPSADAGIVVIYPDGEKVELEYTKTWDDNNVFTWNYLQHYDLNAQADYAKDPALNEWLTDRTINLFVGFADHGELILTADKADLDNGVYAEVSFLLVLDNVMYYAEPIAREVVIVPNPASIDFVDENGNVNNERHFKFYNKPWAMDQVRVTLADGTVLDLTAGDEGVDIFYVGVQTNGKPYADYAAPVHAGVYEVTAQYTARDEQNRVVNLGVGVGVLVIEPAQAEINVENETHEFGSAFETESMITVSSDVNVNIDKTVITVGLKTDGTFSENGLEAIDGDINVDLPKWLDDVLANYDLFNNGLTVSEFVAGVETVKAELAELGINTEILDRLVNVVEQFPATATLTFHDQADVAPTAVGAYLVIGVVTDSNFYPAMDAGLLVIYPAVQKTELSWIYNDVNNNNIYTLDTLEHVDLSAEADIAEANQYVMNLFLGVDVENWKIALVDNQAELNIGVYEEFSFVKPNVNSIIYYAEPISRPVIVVANVYNVSIHEQVVTEMFDNTEKDMGEITVTTMAGEVVDTTKGTLTVTYVGIDTMLRPYYSTEKPVHAGTYTVIATYVGTDDEGKQAVGVGIGTLIITPADVEISVDSHAGLYGADYDLNIKTEHGAINDEAKTLTIIAGVDLSAYLTEGKLGIDSTVNVDFPEAIDNILGELFPELYVNGIGTNAFFAKYDEMVAAIQAHGYTTEVLDNLRTMLAKLNAANLTFNETTEPTESGMYAVIAMVCDPDYKFDVDTALVAISPNATVAELDFVMDMPQLLNAEILPFDMVDEFDFHAYVSALKSTNSGLNPEDIVLKDVIFGLTSDLQLFLGSSEEKPNEMGIYDQIAYAPAAENNLLAVLPIHRDFLITDSSANVVYIDPNGNVNWLREFTYGETVDMGASIMLADGTILEATPNVHYMGIENGIVFYNSTEVPTDAGLYTVIGYFVDAEQNIYTIGLGALKINPKQITVVVDDQTMTVGDALPELTYTVDGLENGDSLTVDVTTEADGTVAGTYDITATYVCDPNYIVTVENGTLTVEEKIAIGTIQFVGPSLNLESEVHYNFDFTLNGFNMDHVVEVGLLRFYTRTDDKNDSNIYTADEVTPGYEIVDGAYRVRSNGIPAKNLGDDGWYRFYVKMSDGTYVYSDRYKYSAKIYTDTVLAGDRYTDDLKALCVSLMNYGAAAQVFFAETTEYTYETLMNAHLSDADLARVQAYSDDMIDERLAFAPSKHGEFAVHDQNVFPNGYNSHLTLLGAITYNFTIDYVAPAGSESGLLIWTQETYETAETLTWENAVEHVMDPDSPIEVAYTGNAAKNMGDTIFACGYVVIDGEYHYTSVFRTSIDTYAKKILASDSYTDSMHTLAEYMLVYGEYAKDYFITNRGE